MALDLDIVEIPQGEGRANVFAPLVTELFGVEVSKVMIDTDNDTLEFLVPGAINPDALSAILNSVIVFRGERNSFDFLKPCLTGDRIYNIVTFSF
jgi:hypothetical protein